MRIEVWGMNHRSAPVGVREKFSALPPGLERDLAALPPGAPGTEIVVLPTCNRFEIYAAAPVSAPEADVPLFLARRFGFRREELGRCLYHYRGCDAIRHLFRVVTSLDSMVVGEAQIFGQAREAFRTAATAGHAGPVLRRLFGESFCAGREIRRRTRIGRGAVSVSSISAGLALKLFGSLAGRSVLVIGAGKTGESAVRHLVSRGIGSVMVANRTFARAVELAGLFNGAAVRFEDLAGAMSAADLVVGCTGSPLPVVTAAAVGRAMSRRNRPILMIDIAVPRDIDPGAADVPGVHLYNIDDLDRMREANVRDRLAEAAAAEHIIEEKIAGMMRSDFWRAVAAKGTGSAAAEPAAFCGCAR